ncbi:hypothetical protein H671_7g17355 [Cricetulus griseus]|nr:hypothetical protein H671_7g17355 [Cricetulus griseus]
MLSVPGGAQSIEESGGPESRSSGQLWGSPGVLGSSSTAFVGTHRVQHLFCLLFGFREYIEPMLWAGAVLGEDVVQAPCGICLMMLSVQQERPVKTMWKGTGALMPMGT